MLLRDPSEHKVDVVVEAGSAVLGMDAVVVLVEIIVSV